jgi:3-methyladenine DNA glycosylase/8-oxoguanine DNA glycosylase
VAPRQKAERELQVTERPGVARDLHLATGEEVHGLVVPQLERNHVAVSVPGEQFAELAERWRPYRSVAVSHLFTSAFEEAR